MIIFFGQNNGARWGRLGKTVGKSEIVTMETCIALHKTQFKHTSHRTKQIIKLFVMKHFLSPLCFVVFLLGSAFAEIRAHSTEPEISCPLPPPQNLTITGATATSISFEWSPVPNGTPPYYKIRLTDLTSPNYLPDVYTTSTSYTYDGLEPGHDYEICVSTSACENGETGIPTCGLGGTTGIVIDLITQNSCTMGLGSNVGQGTNQAYTLVPADNGSSEVHVKRIKIQQAQPLGASYVEFTLWADCNVPPIVHYNQIGQSNTTRTPSGIPQNPIDGIGFTNSNGNFLRINKPTVISANGEVSIILSYFQNSFVQSCDGYQGVCNDCCGSKERDSALDAFAELSSEPAVMLSVRPNPTNGVFQAEYNLPTESTATLTLFDATGNTLRTVQTQGVLEAGYHTISFQMEDLPPGIYFLSLQTDNERKVTTLIKQ
jgi:hypothetical protein